ncbi:hypothetical protein KGA66_14165 [Actinocrinis puniceicyclus]|uniref:Uncharacterized protein n=1 Tax=Actinocrinis puniceicyclus TaxID=977794 RepID=A0A8J7WRG2_9ACTN|nr:hypothetical protein [Actinocrinis puniceicyclus]MBS2964200.1 hypothetical protein [Actinocrinis puniceicyclus]
MDPLTVSAVATAIDSALGAAAADAGKSAWAALVKLVRSAFPQRAAAARAVEQLSAGGRDDEGSVIDLSAELVTLARGDAQFEAALRQWLSGAAAAAVDGGTTTNVITGGATVSGNVVQARDVGSISFGP